MSAALRPDELPRNYYASRLDSRIACELVGMAKGLICDQMVHRSELDGLTAWLEHHPEAQAHFPGREIMDRLLVIYADGVIDDHERSEFLEALRSLVGDPCIGTNGAVATALPIDAPPPLVEFTGRRFVLTGRFAYGSRRECESFTKSLGGTVVPSLSQKVDYLVIGELASEAWITSAYGRKIERAVAMREEHGAPAIIVEAHWLECARSVRALDSTLNTNSERAAR